MMRLSFRLPRDDKLSTGENGLKTPWPRNIEAMAIEAQYPRQNNRSASSRHRWPTGEIITHRSIGKYANSRNFNIRADDKVK